MFPLPPARRGSPAPERGHPSTALQKRNTQKVRRRLEHPGEPRENGKPQKANPKASPWGENTACPPGCQHLASKDPGVSTWSFPLSPCPAALEGSGRGRGALSVFMSLRHLQSCPHLTHQGGSVGPLPTTVPVWEEGMLALCVSWARALLQTQRRQGKI